MELPTQETQTHPDVILTPRPHSTSSGPTQVLPKREGEVFLCTVAKFLCNEMKEERGWG